MQRVITSVRAADRAWVGCLNRWVRRSRPVEHTVALAAHRLAALQVVLLAALGLSGRGGAALRSLVAVALVYGLVELVGWRCARARPFVGVPAVASLIPHQPDRSFPSRHVASAVAMATIAGPQSALFARVMGAVAALLAVTRVAAGLHYPSDVLVGALLGAAAGYPLRRSP